ncbi:MAG: efflux RND transporter periplasmic adaptor subunit [Phycisphaerales bacterium]
MSLSHDEPNQDRRPGWLRIIISAVLSFAVLSLAGGASYLIFSTEPTAEREAQTRKTAALVEVITAERGDFRPTISVLGQVQAAREVVMRPRVAGEVIDLEAGFVPGGLVEEGEPLVYLDPADFERALATRRSELKQIEAELAIEEGRQRVAQQEYELLGEEIDEQNRSLVLREPQIEQLRARLDAARAALDLAALELERTTVRAPFDAQVLEQSVNIGSQVGTGDRLGRLVGTDEYWILASVPLRDLRWLTFADEGDGEAINARVRHSTAWDPGLEREARVTRLIGEVDNETRLARVLLTLPDPLARETDGPAVVLGTLLQVRIEGKQLAGVIRLDREYLRQNDTVWLTVGGELEIRTVTVAFRDATYAYISDGLDPGEQIVTTSLATVTDGLPLRTEDEGPEQSDASQQRGKNGS